jgi:hypothetical protein
MDGIAERLIDVPANIRMKGNHLADGHGFLLAPFPLTFCLRVGSSEAEIHRKSFRWRKSYCRSNPTGVADQLAKFDIGRSRPAKDI